MNERIRELREQARKYARDYVADCKHYGYYMEHSELEVKFEEKFAELIVQDCLDQCTKNFALAIGTYSGAFNTGVKRCRDNIINHFGVEE